MARDKNLGLSPLHSVISLAPPVNLAAVVEAGAPDEVGRFRPRFSQTSWVLAVIVTAGNCMSLWLGYGCVSCTGSQLTIEVLRKQTDNLFLPRSSQSSSILLPVCKGKSELWKALFSRPGQNLKLLVKEHEILKIRI